MWLGQLHIILVKPRFTLSKNLPVSTTEIVVYMLGEMLPDTVLKSRLDQKSHGSMHPEYIDPG
jgi:hypothetical protein